MGRRARRVDDKAEVKTSKAPFTCAHCGEPKPITLYLQRLDGKREPRKPKNGEGQLPLDHFIRSDSMLKKLKWQVYT